MFFIRWWDRKVSELNVKPPVVTSTTETCASTLQFMKKHGYNQVPVVGCDGQLQGMATLSTLLTKLLYLFVTPSDSISKALLIKYPKVAGDAPLGLISRILEKEPFVAVTKMTGNLEKIEGIITNIDVLDYICNTTKN